MNPAEQARIPENESFWNDTGKRGIGAWIFSTDQKRIGFLYFY